MGALPALLMCVCFSASSSPACSAGRSVQGACREMTRCKIMQEREITVGAFPKRRSSCMIPCSIAMHYILCIYVKERQYSATCVWRQRYFILLILLYKEYWKLHRRRISRRATVVSRIATRSVWQPLCVPSDPDSQLGVSLNSPGQAHPRSVPDQTRKGHGAWMCRVLLAVTL